MAYLNDGTEVDPAQEGLQVVVASAWFKALVDDPDDVAALIVDVVLPSVDA